MSANNPANSTTSLDSLVIEKKAFYDLSNFKPKANKKLIFIIFSCFLLLFITLFIGYLWVSYPTFFGFKGDMSSESTSSYKDSLISRIFSTDPSIEVSTSGTKVAVTDLTNGEKRNYVTGFVVSYKDATVTVRLGDITDTFKLWENSKDLYVFYIQDNGIDINTNLISPDLVKKDTLALNIGDYVSFSSMSDFDTLAIRKIK